MSDPRTRHSQHGVRLWKSPWGATLLTLLIGTLISIKVGQIDAERRLSETRGKAIAELATVRAQLEGVVRETFSATSGLVDVVSHQGDITPELFDALCRQAIKWHPQIRNIVAAPDNVVRKVFPLAGNEQVLGLRYSDIPEQYRTVQKAMESGRAILSGPQRLVQGGEGLILRSPVFTRRNVPDGQTARYWGVISIVTQVDAILDAGGVRSVPVLDIALRGRDALGAEGGLFWGNGRIFAEEPVIMEIDIPGGRWQIAAKRKGGWPSASPVTSPLFFVGLLNSVIVAAFVGMLSFRHRQLDRRNRELELEIGERSRTERELRESEQRYASIFSLLPDMVGITRQADGCFVFVNRGFEVWSGWQREEVIGRSSTELGLWSSEDRESAIALIRKKGLLENYEFMMTTKSGELRHALMYLTPITVGGVDCLYFMARDVTEQKRAEQSLHENRRFLVDLIENSGTLIAVKDREGRYEMVNRKWEQVTGLQRGDALGRTDEELFPGPMGRQFRQNDLDAMASGKTIEREEVLEQAGDRRYFISIKFPLLTGDDEIRGICAMITEITERKRAEDDRLRLEQQIQHAQKLESLGVLAGGIAHDFNNILTSIIGNADLALMRISPESPVLDNLRRIETAAMQAADLAKQMLAYSGKGKFVIESIDLNRLIEELLHMLHVSISKKAVLRFNLHRPLPAIEADVTQVRQVLMNLVINASEAIGDKSGVIAVTTGCMECDRDYLKSAWLDENIPEGAYVYMEVADTGCGMAKETLGKIFDPFFTTKFTGRGLGMAAVLGIVRGHKGAIKVYSEAGKGTTFKVLFPAGERPAELFNNIAGMGDWRGSGTVLLADDEETIRVLGGEMLEALGFTVLTAADGRHALEIFRQHPEIRFVVLDLTMPHMDGEQCFRELRRHDPEVKVIMSSGYNEQEVTQKFAGKGLAGFVQKPYKLSNLREAVMKLDLLA